MSLHINTFLFLHILTNKKKNKYTVYRETDIYTHIYILYTDVDPISMLLLHLAPEAGPFHIPVMSLQSL